MKLDEINDVPDIVLEFLEYHSTVRGHSDRTVMAYYLDLKILLRFLKRRRHLVDRSVPFDEIDITDVDLDFIQAIKIEELYRYQSFSPESDQSLSAASRCRRTSTVKSFFKYLTIKRHLLEKNIANIQTISYTSNNTEYLSYDLDDNSIVDDDDLKIILKEAIKAAA